jgi:CubicO group peptidase (beta-lactamase class C family)
MWLASCTKLVITVAALQGVERGLFDLHSAADVDRLLPEWSNSQIQTGFENGQPQLRPAKVRITLYHLLTHTNGTSLDFLPGMIEWKASQGEKLSYLTEPIISMARYPLLFEPGTGWSYGIGLDMAGLMVARASSCTLEDYLRKNVFSVLGMHDTSFYPRKLHDYNQRLMPMTSRVSPDEPLSDGWMANSPIPPMSLDPVDEFGGAGLWGTAEDYLKILKSLLRDDGKVLKPESVAMLFEPTITETSKVALNRLLSVEAIGCWAIPGEPLVGSPGSGEWSYGLAGLIGLTDKEGGLKAPWIQWGGAPNLRWWIDRRGGSCGIFATQLFPAGERKCEVLGNMFQREVTKRYGKPSM